MKSSIIEKNAKIKNDEASSIYMTEDSESLIYDKNDVKISKLNNHSKESNKTVDVINVRHLPTLFFLIFIIVLGLLMTKTIPKLASLSMNFGLYKDRMLVKYVPEELGDQSLAVKGFIIFAQFLLALTLVCLTSLIKQRISVPELIQEKWKNYVVILSSSISVTMMTILLYYNKETLYFSQIYLCLVDNIIFLIYMISTFTYSFMTYDLLSKLNIREVPKNCGCLLFKKALILIMAVQLFCYFISLILVSFYNPYISQEKVLLSILMVCMSINSIIFLLSQVLFVFSLKYDLFYVNMNLQIRPDLEYFVDLDEANIFKATL